jgi:two-component system sensor kinase Ihk
MRKLKLFPKTYLFTMILMGMIILISHTLLYMLLPTFYMNKKQDDLEVISKNLVKKLEKSDEKTSSDIAKEVAVKYKIDILLTIGDRSYIFEGINNVEVYISPEYINDDTLVISGAEDFINEAEIDNNLIISNYENYYKMKSSTIINSKIFNNLNGNDGEVKIMMDIQSINEARSVVFMILPYSVGISLVISLIASYFYVKIITNPIKDICEVTKKMKDLDKDAYCDIDTGDEIEVLATNINSLYKSLWDTIHSLKQEIDNVSTTEQNKVDFLRSASHELKTPLMSIHIMLENMILNIGKYKDHNVYLPRCKDAVIHLSNMVQEILDTSRLNVWNNQNQKKYTIVSLKEVLDNMIEPYKIIAKSKQINMNIDYSDSFEIKSDEKLLTKVLSNVISNAVNYTNEGKNINIYFLDELFVIENECTPIPDEHLEHIFEAFYRADFDRNRDSGGNGLGLYIVKQILMILNIPYSFEATETGMKFTLTKLNI